MRYFVSCLGFCALSLLAGEQKIAVVNVSKVFEQYRKVADIQNRTDAKYKTQKEELNARATSIAQRSREVEAQFQGSNSRSDEGLFDRIQGMRKEQFQYERDVRKLDEMVQRDYTRDMREVLSDIRQAIRQLAETNNYDMVVRSPDSDNPDPVPEPKGLADPNDKRTYFQKVQPKTTYEIIERFNRNPILYGKSTVDITEDVLAFANNKFLRQAILPK